jgi:hypothetical protein
LNKYPGSSWIKFPACTSAVVTGGGGGGLSGGNSVLDLDRGPSARCGKANWLQSPLFDLLSTARLPKPANIYIYIYYNYIYIL